MTTLIRSLLYTQNPEIESEVIHICDNCLSEEYLIKKEDFLNKKFIKIGLNGKDFDACSIKCHHSIEAKNGNNSMINLKRKMRQLELEENGWRIKK